MFYMQRDTTGAEPASFVSNHTSSINSQPVGIEIQAAELWLDNPENHPHAISDLASYLGYSESHLRRHFQRHFAMGPARYRNTLRLERAASLLIRTRRRVIDIAMSCGFRSHAIFSRAFQHHFGTSPLKYRRRYSSPRILPAAEHPEVSIITQPPVSLWALRHYGAPEPCELPHLWAHYRGNPPTDPPLKMEDAIFLLPDDPIVTPAKRQRWDIGVQGHPLCPPTPFHRRLSCRETLAATVTVHKLEQLPFLHAYLLDHWLPRQTLEYYAAPARIIHDPARQCFELLLPLR